MKKILCLVLCVASMIYLLGAVHVSAADYSSRVIKVFYPLQDGFSEKDENGNYSGYTYEFLMKIAQLTGWKYEFVATDGTNKGLTEGLNKVKSGEIDIAGAMVYSEQLSEQYEYSKLPYGATNFTLITLEENAHINQRTLEEIDNLRVALVEKSTIQNTLFEEYALANDIKYTPVYAQNNLDCFELVHHGEADIAISKDVTDKPEFKTVLKLSPQPFYFATSKQNTELIREMNRVIKDISINNPDLQRELHEKYFTKESDFNVALTKTEQEYIDNAAPIRMLVPPNRAPLHSYDEGAGEFKGILIDIIDLIAEKSGLKFKYISVKENDDTQALLESNKADMVVGVSYSFSSLNSYYKSNVLLTSPIFSAPIVRISNMANKSAQQRTIVAKSIKMFDNLPNIEYVDDIARIFMLINSGEYSEAYVNGYMAQHYVEQKYSQNVVITPTPYSNYELCLGVVRGADLRLMSVLEQSISAISPTEIEDIVYKNTVHSVQSTFADYFERNPYQFIVPIVLSLSSIAVLLLLLVFKTKRINRIISEEKNKFKEISQTDKLTRTLNNESFKTLAREFLKSSEPIPCGALIVCDVDDFKAINDTYGHLAGDEILCGVGMLLSSIYRGDDIVGRLGGDEFAVLIKGTTSVHLIEERCAELMRKCALITEKRAVTLSIGVAVFASNIEFELLFKRADTVLYDVKADGKNNYKIYDLSTGDVNSRI